MRRLRVIYDFFRCDLEYGIRNIIRFFPAVWNYRAWDWVYTLGLFYAGISGIEVDEERIPKVEMMARVCEILRHIVNDEYLSLAEDEVGKLSRVELDFESVEGKDYLRLKDNRTDDQHTQDWKIYNRRNELEEEEWSELWEIVSGSVEMHGSDMRGWWD